jgi:hypothetical protein
MVLPTQTLGAVLGLADITVVVFAAAVCFMGDDDL